MVGDVALGERASTVLRPPLRREQLYFRKNLFKRRAGVHGALRGRVRAGARASFACWSPRPSAVRAALTHRQVRRLIENKRPQLPEISISAVQGQFLNMLASSAPSNVFVEVGTLGGYSAAWLACAARGSESPVVHTIERDAARAAFARRNVADAGLGQLVRVWNEPALEAIPKLCGGMQHGSVGLVFLDANKSEYAAYFNLLSDFVAPVRCAVMRVCCSRSGSEIV